MPLERIDSSPPPSFRQGLPMLARLLLLGLLSVLLMVADQRLRISQPLRATVSVLISPMQWLVLQPARLMDAAGQYFSQLDEVPPVLEVGERLDSGIGLADEYRAELGVFLALRDRHHLAA